MRTGTGKVLWHSLALLVHFGLLLAPACSFVGNSGFSSSLSHHIRINRKCCARYQIKVKQRIKMTNGLATAPNVERGHEGAIDSRSSASQLLV